MRININKNKNNHKLFLLLLLLLLLSRVSLRSFRRRWRDPRCVEYFCMCALVQNTRRNQNECYYSNVVYSLGIIHFYSCILCHCGSHDFLLFSQSVKKNILTTKATTTMTTIYDDVGNVNYRLPRTHAGRLVSSILYTVKTGFL